MAYLDHIRACNRRDPSRFVPFYAAEKRIGWIARDQVHPLTDFKDLFLVSADRVDLSSALDTPEARSEALDPVCRVLTDRGLTPPRREEAFPVGTRFGECLFTIERACIPFFGVRAYGLHVNGFVRRNDELLLWIPRRRDDLVVAPGKLDNMVAGGQPAGLTLTENLIKEADEEASVPADLARRARSVGVISYVMENSHGLKPDILFNYDLETPADFTPINRDGEVGDFRLIPAQDVMNIVDESEAFKFNSNLVLIDFFIRHGLLTPDHPDYVDLAVGLHQ